MERLTGVGALAWRLSSVSVVPVQEDLLLKLHMQAEPSYRSSIEIEEATVRWVKGNQFS